MPADIELRAIRGETVMGAARRLGYWWPTSCHGDGVCSICWCVVLDGAEHLSEISASEERTLSKIPKALARDARLACQAIVLGDVVVRKKGVSRLVDTKPL